jgi:hypothetical protein
MAYQNPLVSVFCSLIPGLGQIYNGEIERGVVFFFGTYFSVFLFITGTFGLFGYGGYYDVFIGFLLLGVTVWVASGYDGYYRATQINAGTIPFKKPHFIVYISFFVMVFVAIVILIGFTGYLLLSAMIAWIEAESEMHSVLLPNITVTVERQGSLATIYNGYVWQASFPVTWSDLNWGKFISHYPDDTIILGRRKGVWTFKKPNNATRLWTSSVTVVPLQPRNSPTESMSYDSTATMEYSGRSVRRRAVGSGGRVTAGSRKFRFIRISQ